MNEPDEESKSGVGIRISSDPETTHISRPAESRADRRIQIPLRLLLVSDLTPQAAPVDWTGPSRVRRVDSNSFSEFLRESQVTLKVEVPNRIKGTREPLELDLTFPDLAAFGPERVAEQIAPLRQLVRIRSLVSDALSKRIDAAKFRSGLADEGIDEEWATRLHDTVIEKPEPRATVDPADPVERILGMVSLDDSDALPGGSQEGPSDFGPLAKLIRAVSGDDRSDARFVPTGAKAVLKDLDEIIGRQLKAVLDHPSFRALESVWRGLKFLVDRLDSRRGTVLDVLAAGRSDLATAMHHQVLLPEHSATAAEPLATIVLDFDFSQKPDDMALMEDLAGTGESLQVPILAAASGTFFGAGSAADLARIPGLRQYQSTPEFIGWNAFRQQSRSKYLALAVPPFVLRERHEDASDSALAFLEDQPLWGGPALAVAVTLSKSQVETGWPTRFLDASNVTVDEVELWGSGAGAIPLAAAINLDKQAELEAAGFVVLGCRLNHDSIHVARAPMVFKPDITGAPEADAEARSHASLTTQVFISRIAQFILALENEIKSDASTDEVISELSRRLVSFLAVKGEPAPPDCVSVEYVPDAGEDRSRVFAVRIRPTDAVVPHPLSLVLGFEVA